MQLYADTADIEEIRKLADIGIIDGVTTNPSLLAAVGLDRDEAIAEITKLVPGPVSSEVIATDAEGSAAEPHQHRYHADDRAAVVSERIQRDLNPPVESAILVLHCLAGERAYGRLAIRRVPPVAERRRHDREE